MRFGGSEVTEPRDLIYALRGMSSDAKDASDLYPDYTKSEEELVRDAILFLYPLQNGDLAALQLPMTIHELVSKLGELGHHIYCNMFREMELASFPATQTWNLISPDQIIKMLSSARLSDLQSPSAINSRLLLAKLQGDRTADAAALFRFGLSRDNLRTEHLIAAVENRYGVKSLEIVFDFVSHEFEITEEVLVPAARNRDHGDKMMELLLHHPSCQRYITQDVIMTAEDNAGCGQKILKIVAKYENSRCQ